MQTVKNVKDDDRKRKWGREMRTAYGESEKSKKPLWEGSIWAKTRRKRRISHPCEEQEKEHSR